MYLGCGRISLEGIERNVKSIRMICAGSGITPILAVLSAIMEDKEDPTTCVVLDGNREEGDILCRDQVDTLTEQNQDRLKLVHTLSKPSKGWTGRRGRVDEALIREEGRGGDLWLVCGPEGLEREVKRILSVMEVADENVVFF